MSSVPTPRDARGRTTRLPPALAANVWKPGQSGNPSGRGGEYQRCLALCRENSFDAAQEIIRLSRESDDERVRYMAATWVYERAWGKAEPTFDRVEFEMPSLQSGADLTAAMAAVIQAASQGRITLGQAADFAKLLQLYGQTASVGDPDDLSSLTDEELRERILKKQAAYAAAGYELEEISPTVLDAHLLRPRVTRIESVIIDPKAAGPQAD